ncbi:hypothetical protein OVA24_15445 [Luteolibacter sp. SL250]|uniref:hypothetical protein n=1 Tax=Luteolibacter sp. SL250 TaxID=2995170 RepID=UPI00226DFB18|nr:hypothetical protein [Luteolibacter sp. SL250]WAC18626.1 hypothetical protein OVA24_15445 [Luteolibacter sp. SL250]
MPQPPQATAAVPQSSPLRPLPAPEAAAPAAPAFQPLPPFQPVAPAPEVSATFVPPQEFHEPTTPTFAAPTVTPSPAAGPAAVPEPIPSPAPISRDIPDEPDFTDDDLREAFAPIFKGITVQASPIDLHLEPMLRATIRRALAEYSPTTGRPFTNPGMWDRFKWRMRALFTSRTYEDILFEKTNRFQVDEVFLLDSHNLSLVSYASTNPGRHASAKRVEGTVHRLALQLRETDGTLRRYFKLPDDRNVIVREGAFISLVAVFHGMPNEMAINDLGYTLGSIEERFEERYRIPGSPLLKLLQPFLEDCLLIQAPATAA